MKKNLICFLYFVLLCSGVAFAQNKTLGVGVTTPNQHAALHVESPTNNQGFIMPRLTTVQRTAMATLPLGTDDAGIMVYDSDLKGIYIWDGANWAAGAKLGLPVNETITNSTPNSSIFRLVNSGTATGNFGVASFENTNPNSGFSPLYVNTMSTTNGAIDVVVNNTANTNDGIGVTTNGLGTAGRFVVNNASNGSAALYATTNGTGGVTSAAILAETSTAFSAITGRVAAGTSNAISGISNSTDAGSFAVLGQNNGPGPGGVFLSKDGTGLTGKTQSNVGGALAPVGVYGESIGTGSSAAAFRINNTSNTFSSVFAETNGGGPVYFANQIGTGTAAHFQINNSANGSEAINATTNGTGSTLVLSQTNGGFALDIQQGGLKFPVLTVPDVTKTLPNDAVIVRLTGSSSQTISLPLSGVEGQVIYVMNDGTTGTFVNGSPLSVGSTATFFRLGTSWIKVTE